MATSSPSQSSTTAPTRFGAAVRPALRSAMASASASIRAPTSRSSSTSRRLSTNTDPSLLGRLPERRADGRAPTLNQPSRDLTPLSLEPFQPSTNPQGGLTPLSLATLNQPSRGSDPV